MKGTQGIPGRPGKSGVVYTRWGRTSCPNVSGTELVYRGRAGGSWFSDLGGGANYLCMPTDPQYDSYVPGVQGYSHIYGVEYEILQSGAPIPNRLYNLNVPCAVCYVQERGSLLMIPARKDCPTSWTKEYEGALMTTASTKVRGTHYRTMFECVDEDAESVHGSAADSTRWL